MISKNTSHILKNLVQLVLLLIAGNLLLALVVFVPWALLGRAERARFKPPDGVDTFEEFVAQMPPPEHLSCVSTPEGNRIVWLGKTASIAASPSGPSCYVFSNAGELLFWDATTGDNEKSTPYMSQAFRKDKCSYDDVRKVLKDRDDRK